jgi:membrane protein DedA with SNARE-associated domain
MTGRRQGAMERARAGVLLLALSAVAAVPVYVVISLLGGWSVLPSSAGQIVLFAGLTAIVALTVLARAYVRVSRRSRSETMHEGG